MGLESLKPPVQGRSEYSDRLLPNFFVRVSSSGLKSFTFMYRFRGKQRRADIGSYPPLTLGEAREMARQVWAEVQRGGDPRETLAWLKNRESARRATAAGVAGGFTDLCHAYLADSSHRLRTSTHQFYRRLINGQMIPAFGSREPSTITRADVKAWCVSGGQEPRNSDGRSWLPGTRPSGWRTA